MDTTEAFLGENIPSKKLPLTVKLGFGICDLGGNLFFTIMGFYLLFFLTDVVYLGAGLAGTALMVGKIWDAVTDPAVGYFSDRTRTQWGRRRPYMFIGAFLLFFFMILMFTAPGYESQGSLFAWAASMYCLLCTAYTLVNIPYGALTPELTADYNERTTLNAFRMTFAVVGTLVGATMVIPIAATGSTVRSGWSLVGAVMGAVMMLTALVTVITVQEPKHPPVDRHTTGIFKSYIEVLSMKEFITALVPWTLHITGITVIQGALLYFFTYIHQDEAAFQVALGILLVTSMICIPIWTMISRTLGKKLCYNIGMGIVACAAMLFFLFGHAYGVVLTYLIMALVGIGFATQYVMPYAIVPDVVEYDFTVNGIRREGVFYGLWTFTSKVGQALAILLSGWMLTLFRYVPDAAQEPLALLGIRLLCGPIPVVFFLGGIIVLSFYPITPKRYQEILDMQHRRDGGGSA